MRIERERKLINDLVNIKSIRKTWIPRLLEDDFQDSEARALFIKLKGCYEKGMDFTKELASSFRLDFNLDEIGSESPNKTVMAIIASSQLLKLQKLHFEEGRVLLDQTIPINEKKLLFESAREIFLDTRDISFPLDNRSSVIALRENIKKGKFAQITWGINSLNKTPLQPGNLACIAARPSVGKTAMACSCLLGYHQLKKPAGFLCIEMSRDEILMRMASQLSGLYYSDIMRDDIYHENERNSLDNAMEELSNSPLKLLCGQSFDFYKARDLIMHWVIQDEVKIIFIDYLQKMRHEKAESYRLSVAKTTERLKALARELEIPIVILAQLNRDADDTQPKISQLKETGAIEEDCDIILLLDRKIFGREFKRKYKRNVDGLIVDVDMEDKAAVICAKNRNGSTGIEYLDFTPRTMAFN